MLFGVFDRYWPPRGVLSPRSSNPACACFCCVLSSPHVSNFSVRSMSFSFLGMVIAEAAQAADGLLPCPPDAHPRPRPGSLGRSRLLPRLFLSHGTVRPVGL